VGIELRPEPSGRGWTVAAVRPGGPADLSGVVHPGDLILTIDGIPTQVTRVPILQKPRLCSPFPSYNVSMFSSSCVRSVCARACVRVVLCVCVHVCVHACEHSHTAEN
jgi:hypothetical protein